MSKTLQNRIWILLVLILIFSGCGRKEAPQIMHDSQPPQLVELRYKLQDTVLKLDFKLLGSAEGVGYQIDRAEMDPYCKCPGLWQRYFEQLPIPKNIDVPITKFLGLHSRTIEFVFRIRAFDAAGQLGPWSKSMSTLAAGLNNQ